MHPFQYTLAVAAQLPLVDLKDVVVCGLTTLRCGHNPLSYTGTELLLRSLVANSRLVVLDCRSTLYGDGPGLEQRRYHQVATKMIAEAKEAADAAAASKKKGGKKGAKGAKGAKDAKGAGGKDKAAPAGKAAAKDGKAGKAGGAGVPPPDACALPVRPLGGGRVDTAVPVTSLHLARNLRVALDDVVAARPSGLKAVFGFPETDTVHV